MKKIYISIIIIINFVFIGYTQIEYQDNFDSYSPGENIATQSDNWRTWSGDNEEDAEITTFESSSPLNSVRIDKLQDIITNLLLLVESQPSSGIYTIQWDMFVKNGTDAYFNAQSAITLPQIDTSFGGNIYFNKENLTPGQGFVDGVPGQTFTFSHDTWFTVKCIYNLNTQFWSMLINDVEKITNQEINSNDFTVLGAINFRGTGFDDSHHFFIDNVIMGVSVLSNNDLTTNEFSIYPNPIKNMLNINSNAVVSMVTVYNILGKTVLQEQPNSISPSINLKSLSSGAYFVKILINKKSYTTKIIK
jgi:hypothetical protein